MTLPREAYYRHSGRTPPAALGAGLGAGLGLAVILAFVYSYAIAYIPVIGYVTFILSAGYGAAVGGLTAWVFKRAKARSVGASFALGLVVTLASYYVSWAAWTFAVLQRAGADVSVFDLLAPDRLWETVLVINRVGVWSLRGAKPTGTVLWVLWAVEALLVVGFGVFAASAVAMGHAFCEACGTWCVEHPRALTLPPGDSAELTRRVEARDFAALTSAGASPPGSPEWHQVDLQACPQCGATNTLTLEHVVLTHDSKGNASERKTMLVDMLLVTPQEVAVLRPAAPAVTPFGATGS